MQVTITETLRLKNDLANTVRNLQYQVNVSAFGVKKENGEPVSSGEVTFAEVEEKLIKALDYSEELNGKVAFFNKENAVDSLVRKQSNKKLLLSMYSNNLPKTKPSKTTRFETVGDKREKVDIEYVPAVTTGEFKTKLSKLKTEIRELQSQVESLNANTLDLSFSYADIESLSI